MPEKPPEKPPEKLFDSFIRPEIAAMDTYTPIVPFNVLSRRLNRRPEDIIKLDANENPYGPSPRIYRALADEAYYHIYPDPESTTLREALSKYTGIDAAHIVAGHGADELIDLVIRLFITPGDAVLNCPPTFGMYPFDTELNGGRVVTVPRREDFSVDVARLVSTVSHSQDRGGASKLLFLTSPNNPDGGLLGDAALRELLALPLIVVLDEAYIEFAGQETAPTSVARGPVPRVPSPTTSGTEHENPQKTASTPVARGPVPRVPSRAISGTEHENPQKTALTSVARGPVPRVPSRAHWVQEYENLIVLRTFSKWAGLAGLRVGYGIFPQWIRTQLLKIKQPYNVNVAGTAAAIASLEDVAYLMENVRKIVHEREQLRAALEQIDFLEPYPSHANFILCRVSGRPAAELKAELAQQGILIRYFNTPGLQEHIRISVGKPSETEALLKAFAR